MTSHLTQFGFHSPEVNPLLNTMSVEMAQKLQPIPGIRLITAAAGILEVKFNVGDNRIIGDNVWFPGKIAILLARLEAEPFRYKPQHRVNGDRRDSVFAGTMMIKDRSEADGLRITKDVNISHYLKVADADDNGLRAFRILRESTETLDVASGLRQVAETNNLNEFPVSNITDLKQFLDSAIADMVLRTTEAVPATV